MNGLVFSTSEELASQFQDILSTFPPEDHEQALLTKLRAGVKGMIRWEANWVECAGPTFSRPGRSRLRAAGVKLGITSVCIAVLMNLRALIGVYLEK